MAQSAVTGPERPTAPADHDPAALERDLRARVDGEVRFDDQSRALYATDASNFRQVPVGVVVPRSVEAAAEAVRVCRDHRVPLVGRGGGTSLAGQCTNTAVVLDFSKHCNRLLSVDVENRRCTVEPGIVLDDLNRRLEQHGLRFGPEPATHFNCTVGGMIGNNSCGATAQRTGKTVDNVHALEVMLADGTRFRAGRTDDEEYRRIEARGDRRAEVYRTLRRVRDQYGDLIRDKYPDIPRRVSGYNLDSLLPEYGFDIGRFLVGSEGTLVTVLRAELDLVEVLPEKVLVVLGYPDVCRAGDAVPRVLQHDPIALEGLDDLLIHDQQLKHLNPDALRELPRGAGFLMVQFGATSAEEARAQAHRMMEDLEGAGHAPTIRFFADPEQEHELWLVRESGLAATAEVPHRPRTHEGWEDSAVHPDDLGSYLRDLQALFEEFDYASDVGPSLYGHFGQACVHTRIPFDLTTSDGVRDYRRFMERAADLCVGYGGSLSGEHGDGQSRGELLPKMFGDELVGVMERVKTLFDPLDLMNPGKVVRPYWLDENLRLGRSWAPMTPEDTFFQFPHDEGSFVDAVTRCVGVGKCRQTTHQGPSVMCPSYQATGEEKHATRGRARLLFEMLDGHGDSPVRDRWRSEEVRDALDLCLACKGCKHDCPASVDMATYKAEFLAHHYAGRLRPRADYATGWLPVAARWVHRLGLSGIVNAAGHTPGLHWLGLKAAGLDTAREVPLFAGETLQGWFARTHADSAGSPLARGRGARPGGGGSRGRVLLWPDTFTNHFSPEIGRAAVGVLERAGWEVTMPSRPVCCGLTWISTGQLGTARRMVRDAVESVAEHVRDGGLVVGLEPSCTTVFRADAPEMFPDDRDVQRLRDATVTFAELLMEHTPGWEPPRLAADHATDQSTDHTQPRAVAQVHCHQHAVLGWDADRRLLEAVGLDTEQLASGCCGLAGNFGFTEGHREVSEACAEQVLLPRLREEPAETVVLADGFSCRTQVHDLDSGGHEGVHLAEVVDLAERAGRLGTDPRTDPDTGPDPVAHRTPAPGVAARLGVAAAALAPVAGLAAIVVRRRT